VPVTPASCSFFRMDFFSVLITALFYLFMFNLMDVRLLLWFMFIYVSSGFFLYFLN